MALGALQSYAEWRVAAGAGTQKAGGTMALFEIEREPASQLVLVGLHHGEGGRVHGGAHGRWRSPFSPSTDTTG